MRRRLHVIAVILLVSAPVVAQRQAAPAAQPAAPNAGALPVRRVVLYKTGVGYFEHLGNVRDRQDVTIRFTSAPAERRPEVADHHRPRPGQVTGISYNSVAPVDQRLSACACRSVRTRRRWTLLAALRGARVEVSSGQLTVAGRLLSVEQQHASARTARRSNVATRSRS